MNNDRAMASQEEAYLAEAEEYIWCGCGTKKKNGVCPNCDAPDYNPDDEVD